MLYWGFNYNTYPENSISLTSNIKAVDSVQQGDNLIKVRSELEWDGAISPMNISLGAIFLIKLAMQV